MKEHVNLTASADVYSNMLITRNRNHRRKGKTAPKPSATIMAQHEAIHGQVNQLTLLCSVLFSGELESSCSQHLVPIRISTALALEG